MSNNLLSSENGSSLAVMVQESLQRLASQSAACKWSSVLLGTAALVGCRLGGEHLLWLAAPSLLLALADAGYAAQARRIAEFAGRALNGSNKDPGRAGELIRLQASGWGFQGALGGLMGLLSFTVWPFYVALAAVVVTVGTTQLAVPAKTEVPVAPSGPYRPGQMPYPPQAGMPYGVPSNPNRTAVHPAPLSGKPTIGSPGAPTYGPGVNSTLPSTVRPTLPTQPQVRPQLTPPPPPAAPGGSAATPPAAAPSNAAPPVPTNPAPTAAPSPVPSAIPVPSVSPPTPLKPEASAASKPLGSP